MIPYHSLYYFANLVCLVTKTGKPSCFPFSRGHKKELGNLESAVLKGTRAQTFICSVVLNS